VQNRVVGGGQVKNLKKRERESESERDEEDDIEKQDLDRRYT
jgi:hypothetical protein